MSPPPHGITNHHSLFRFRVANKRFDEDTLRLLEAELVYGDLKALLQARSRLTSFLRSRSYFEIRQLADRPPDQKLSVLEFFLRAFALLGDIESCLALKYEGLLLRESESARCQWLRVSATEWLDFAKHLLRHGFHSVAIQACGNALSCLQRRDAEDYPSDEFERAEITAEVSRIKQHALGAAAPGSVQAQATDHLRKKAVEKSKIHDVQCKETYTATALFNKGIKMRNARKLHQSLNVKPNVGPS